MLRPGGRAFVPLDVGSLTAFDAVRRLLLWSYTKIADPRYHFGDRLIEIDHTKVKPAPPGQSGRRDDESKIGVDSGQGWAAYLLDGTLFLKRFPHDATGHVSRRRRDHRGLLEPRVPRAGKPRAADDDRTRRRDRAAGGLVAVCTRHGSHQRN